MTEKEFMEITELLKDYIGRFDEEFEDEGYSDHHSHYLYFHKKQPIIVISDRVYKSLLEYVSYLIMTSCEDNITITKDGRVSLKNELQQWSIVFCKNSEGKVVGCKDIRFNNCKIEEYETDDMEDDYDPILIKYSDTMIIEKKDRSLKIIERCNTRKQLVYSTK